MFYSLRAKLMFPSYMLAIDIYDPEDMPLGLVIFFSKLWHDTWQLHSCFTIFNFSWKYTVDLKLEFICNWFEEYTNV